jgi:uncharacterized protein (TIGR00369 family)
MQERKLLVALVLSGFLGKEQTMPSLQALLQTEPFLVSLGLEVVNWEAQTVALRMPLRQELTNHLGMLHGGAQYCLGEATAIALAATLVSDQLASVNLLTANASITYQRPAQGELIGHASIAAEEQSRLRAIFDEKGRVRVPVTVELTDTTGQIVTTLAVECVVLASR